MAALTLADAASRTMNMARKWVKAKEKNGHLTTAGRESLPKSDFALPGHGEGAKGKGAGSYPIPDASHARNALARVSQHGTPEEKAKVRAAVHRKFPGIGESGEKKKSKMYDHPRSNMGR